MAWFCPAGLFWPAEIISDCIHMIIKGIVSWNSIQNNIGKRTLLTIRHNACSRFSFFLLHAGPRQRPQTCLSSCWRGSIRATLSICHACVIEGFSQRLTLDAWHAAMSSFHVCGHGMTFFWNVCMDVHAALDSSWNATVQRQRSRNKKTIQEVGNGLRHSSRTTKTRDNAPLMKTAHPKWKLRTLNESWGGSWQPARCLA